MGQYNNPFKLTEILLTYCYTGSYGWHISEIPTTLWLQSYVNIIKKTKEDIVVKIAVAIFPYLVIVLIGQKEDLLHPALYLPTQSNPISQPILCFGKVDSFYPIAHLFSKSIFVRGKGNYNKTRKTTSIKVKLWNGRTNEH